MKIQTEKEADHSASFGPEISLIAILTAMVLLRVLDICSTTASGDLACTPTAAYRAVIACTVRPDQDFAALEASKTAPSFR